MFNRSDTHRCLFCISLETDCAATLPSEHLTTPTGQSAPSSLQGADIASRLSQHSRHADIFRKDASRTSASVSDDRPSVSLGNAAYPHFATSQSRLATFQRWPLAHVFPPQSMVSYGFYYAGICLPLIGAIFYFL